MAESKSDNSLREAEKTLGQIIADARKRRGLSPEEASRETRIPPHYVKMIETDSGSLISDQLYLLPFIRRYASFLGLDAEEIASRFVHDVQRAETNVVRMSRPIAMADRKGRGAGRWWRIFIFVTLAACAILAADLLWYNYDELKQMVLPAAAPSPIIMPPSIIPTPAVSELPPSAEAEPPPGATAPQAPAN